MAIRPRTRLQLRRAVITAALGALVVPACAGAAVKKPVITKVTPKTANVGEELTIRGKHFRVGKRKNKVLFKRVHGKALFVKAGLSTRKKMKVTIPKTLEKYMKVKAGQPAATRFRLRLLTRRLSKRYTPRKRSPLIGPEVVKPPTGDGSGTPVVPLDPNADADGDGLTTAFEQGVVNTNATLADTDGDGLTDGYEYASAIDLNNDSYLHPTSSLPYAGKRPYPNPLDASDSTVDFDGDALTGIEEYDLWRYSITRGGSSSLQSLTYSAGRKYSQSIAASGYDRQAEFKTWLESRGGPNVSVWAGGGTATVDFFELDGVAGLRSGDDGVHPWAEDSPYDTHGRGLYNGPDGLLSDDERDEDGDGLSNWVELHGQMLPTWYTSMYKSEKPYPVTYAGVSPTDPDSDGDGVRDGADDQDHDEIPNYRELSRAMVIAGDEWNKQDDDLTAGVTVHIQASQVNPYNPCLPYTDSRTCSTYVEFDNLWAPFDSKNPGHFYVFN